MVMIKQQVQYLAMWTQILNSQPEFVKSQIYDAHKHMPNKAIATMVINMTVRKELRSIFDK